MCKPYGSSQAAVVTTYAGDDILRSSFFNFSGPVRVSKCRTTKGYKICLSIFEYLFSKSRRRYPSCRYNRDLYIRLFLYSLVKLYIKTMFHIGSCRKFIQIDVSAAGNVKGVNTDFFQSLCKRDCFINGNR